MSDPEVTEEVKEVEEISFKKKGARRGNIRTKEKPVQKAESSDEEEEVDTTGKVREPVSSKGISSSSASSVKSKEETEHYVASRTSELKSGSADATMERRDAAQAPVRSSSGTSGFSATPVNAPSNVRAICRFDYQADICKDYKETGYCVFGDTCIFMHDRSQQTSSWKLDKQWEERQAQKKRKLEELEAMIHGDTDKSADESQFPETCTICSGPFQDPVVTPCGHFFCSSCANSHYQSKKAGTASLASVPRCPTCSKPLSGLFNRAHKLIKYLETLHKNEAAPKETKFQSRGTWT